MVYRHDVTAYHSRLAIQGLTKSSNQPYIGQHSSILVFNGEILNWRDLLKHSHPHLANELESDTQFLSHILDSGLIQDLIHQFRGFFAFVYYNPLTKVVLAARDCYGVKPLYHTLIGGVYPAFASTAEALSTHPYLAKQLNSTSLVDFMKFGFFPFGSSAFSSINQFPCGKLYKYTLDNNSALVDSVPLASFTPYDSYLTYSKSFGSQSFSSDLLLNTLVKSCELRAVSDVPISLFLSGGIDSSLLALVYAKYLGIKPDCFTLKFDGSDIGDESEVAAQTAAVLGLTHHILPFSSSDISQSVERVFLSLDQPFVDTSIIPTYILCDFVSDSFKVAISADGGDEAFAGYPKYQRFRSIYSKLSAFDRFPSSILNILPSSKFPQRTQKLISALTSSDLVSSIYFLQHQIWSDESLQDLLTDDTAIRTLPDIPESHLFASRLSFLQYLDIIFYMLDDILYKTDRASMANGLELREPMLDQDFVSLGLCAPDQYKQNNNNSKVALRELVDHHLPHVSMLPKKGFGIPLDLLYKSEFMQDSLSDSLTSDSGLWNILNRKRISSLLQSSALTDNQEWQLRSLLVWCKIHSV